MTSRSSTTAAGALAAYLPGCSDGLPASVLIGERSQTLAAVAAWGMAVEGAGAAVGVRETVEGSGRGRRRRCRCGGAGGGGSEIGQPDGPSV